jgi:hypothetical protein
LVRITDSRPTSRSWRGIAADVAVYTKRKAAGVVASDPSLGRKRPRSAAIAGWGWGALPRTPTQDDCDRRLN